MSRALIVVDVQVDFCEGGALPVAGGARVAAEVGALLARWAEDGTDRPAYDHVVATRDHHVDPGTHWSSEPDYVDSWPVHCEVGTPGAEFHPDLWPRPFDAVFLKGEHEAAYSGFEGRTTAGQPLADWLRERGIGEVEICGIAADHCVRATALDAVGEGFATTLLNDLTVGVAPESTEAALAAMRDGGVRIS